LGKGGQTKDERKKRSTAGTARSKGKRKGLIESEGEWKRQKLRITPGGYEHVGSKAACPGITVR